MSAVSRLQRYAGPAAGLFLFVASLTALHHLLQTYHYDDIADEFASLSAGQLGRAFGLTLLSYGVMSLYDLLAIRYLRRVIPTGKVMFAAVVSYAFSNSVGVSILTSGSVRLRFYAGWGLSAVEIGKLVLFCSLTLWLGLVAVGGGVLLAGGGPLPVNRFGLGVPLSLAALAYVALCLSRRPLRWRSVELAPPPPRLALGQLAVGMLDWSLAGAVLYQLLPAEQTPAFGTFLSVYLVAQMLSLLSHVPGGLGVFESLMLMLLPGMPAASLMGALLAYRVVYYLLPLALAAIALSLYEALREARRAPALLAQLSPWLSGFMPGVYAIWALVSGAVLLMSGATPALVDRMAWLEELLPLPLVELSHFLASLIGVALLLLARGLHRKLNAAWLFTTVLLAAGSLVSLLKGGDYEEAGILFLLLAALYPARGLFYRHSSLFDERFSGAWLAAVAALLVASTGLGLFAYKHVEYEQQLWWSFSFGEEGNAPRFMRAQIGVFALVAFLALARLLRPARFADRKPDPATLTHIVAIVADYSQTYAHLALVGDKNLLLSEDGAGFLMYGVEGRSWVAMGDPVGDVATRRELAWRFRELGEVHDGWTAFYQVHPEGLELYVDLGLSLLKIGEEARVRLSDFALEGKTHRNLRSTCNRVQRDGYRFEILSTEEVAAALPQLDRVSKAWLGDKNTREKRFSLGCFNADYLQRGPVAIVRRDDAVVAFANLWLGGQRHEASVDLMRQLPVTERGLMDFLFARLMLWAKEQGYQWFNLGMAPLSGLPNHALAPAWNRFGSLVFGHGENFYNFAGIRQYKDKFAPCWEPRYLALPPQAKLPVVLFNIATLIAGGLRGIVSK